MILVFDLDDTLYEEITYVKSSFAAVSKYLSQKFNLSADQIYSDLISVLEQKGRGSVFDEVLEKYEILSKSEVKKCLTIYRKNYPEIQLSKEAKVCLEKFKEFPKYLVTDGNKMVQTLKIEALGLDQYFKKSLPTHNFGRIHAKPSTYVFHKILEWENANPDDLVYIGDNPNKDFVNLKKEGFKTVRVLTGMFKALSLNKEFEADYKITSLMELDFKLLSKIFNKKLDEN